MKLYIKDSKVVLEKDEKYFELGIGIDKVFQANDPLALIVDSLSGASNFDSPGDWDAPIGNQEVWAAGVTYFRSRDARMEESKSAGGADFYDRVYDADRPELFFKATAPRVVGPNKPLRIRKDSKWNVPEPELALVINHEGKIFGYSVGNDMSSRDIEGENPLYLPQAKVYAQSCGLGPCIYLSDTPISKATGIQMTISRGGNVVFEGSTTLESLKRDPIELAGYLFRDNEFPCGSFLFTGTGIVPDDTFTLEPDDEIEISIDGIGSLKNSVFRVD